MIQAKAQKFFNAVPKYQSTSASAKAPISIEDTPLPLLW